MKLRDSIVSYLERIDPARRKYAEEYLAWRTGHTAGDMPKPVGLNNGTINAMRKRIDQMLRGESTYPPEG